MLFHTLIFKYQSIMENKSFLRKINTFEDFLSKIDLKFKIAPSGHLYSDIGKH